MIKRLVYTILFLFLFILCGCNGVKEYLTLAEEAYSKQLFSESVNYYEKALNIWNDREKYEYTRDEIQTKCDEAKQKADNKLYNEIYQKILAGEYDIAESFINSSNFFYNNTNRKELLLLENNLISQLTDIGKYVEENDLETAKSELVAIKNRIDENRIVDSSFVYEKYRSLEDQIKKTTERFNIALKKMRTEYDDIKEVTWYTDRTTTPYGNRHSVHIYIGKEKTGSPWLRFRVQYTADDWLFVRSYIFKCDEDTYDYSPYDVERDNDYGRIWEWSDENVDAEIYKIILSIISSSSCKIRYNGDQYHYDRVITQAEKNAIRNVMDAFEALGGKLEFGE